MATPRIPDRQHSPGETVSEDRAHQKPNTCWPDVDCVTRIPSTSSLKEQLITPPQVWVPTTVTMP